MQTGNGRSNGFGSGLTILLVVVQVITLTAVFHRDALASPANESALLQGIIFTGSYTDDDVSYLRDNLQFLHDQLPQWWKYIEDAKPLVFAIDLTEGAHGRAAIAECCDANGRGVITFGHHFGTLTDSSDPASQTPEARRLTFLATLVHEVTHIRDQRAGKFLIKTDRKTCIAGEKSGLEKQLEFQEDALKVELGDDAESSQTYRARLGQTVKAEAAALKSRDLWDQYCGTF